MALVVKGFLVFDIFSTTSQVLNYPMNKKLPPDTKKDIQERIGAVVLKYQIKREKLYNPKTHSKVSDIIPKEEPNENR